MTDEDDGHEIVDYNTSGTPSLWLPFSLASVELVDTPQLLSSHTDNFSPSIKVRLLCQGGPRLQFRSFLYIKPEPSL